ncbi:MAG: 3-hydroxyacyl-CoA dehydrogenase [Flavobacteriaceae bacterium]|nr:MAG: 3-hydroxyacyl-CoA dehydrogenase [Flavobacteriaceae bacterium]
MKKHINHVTVLGSGVMGTGIACHFANIGVQVLMLDIVPRELAPEDTAKGLTMESPAFRNKIAAHHLGEAMKNKPAALYDASFASRITIGNMEDDLEKIKNSDWIIEVVIERLDIKKSVFEKVDALRKPGSLVSSNTSGIPIHLMTEGRSEDFKKHFLGTHFFNPPRYLRLFEVIPTPDTDQAVVDFFVNYGELYLGKKSVLCKDTPGFIGNRVGVYSMAKISELATDLGLTVEETDLLTGPIIGRPKTGTFKLTDLVGVDVAEKVTHGLQENAPHDNMVNALKPSSSIEFLIKNNFLGNKSRKGYYTKTKGADGKDVRLALDLNTLEYREEQRPTLPAVEAAKQAGGLGKKIASLLAAKDKAGDLTRKHFAALLSYVSNRVPEISDVIYSVDDAMTTGYAWNVGPFQYWDLIGLEAGIALIESEGHSVSDWTKDMVKDGNKTFYKLEGGKKMYFDVLSKSYKAIPGQENYIVLDNLRGEKKIWENAGGQIIDLGDGIINLEFRSKMNSIGGEVLEAINYAIDLAEKEYRGLVIANNADNFSVGANLGMILMLAADGEWEDLNAAVKYFQDTTMRIRYSSIPVVSGVQGMVFGGGCEITLHSDKVVAAAESYMGLVEFGVGLLPGGGGTKELTRRAALGVLPDDVQTNRLRNAYMTIGTAKVSTSAYEAFDSGLLIREKDTVVVNKERVIVEAKKQCLAMADAGYTKPISEKVLVQGKEALGMFLVGADQMLHGHYISEHDKFISDKIAYVMTGGNLSGKQYVSEQYLLDLERQAFVELAQQRKTLERMQFMLTKGKPLRN